MMGKIAIWPMLTFTLGLFVATVSGVAHLHVAFASKEYVKEVKADISTKLDRIDDKLDKVIEKLEGKEDRR